MTHPVPPSSAQAGGGEAGTVTAVDGACFCISGRQGDVQPHGSQGFFYLGTRFLSELRVLVNDESPELLDVLQDGPFAATFVLRCRPPEGQRDSTIVVERRRWAGHGLCEEIVVRNLSSEATYCRVEVQAAADFADVADIRAGRNVVPHEVAATPVDGGIELVSARPGRRRAVRIVGHGSTPPLPARDGVGFEGIVAAGTNWRCCIEVVPVVDGEQIEPRHRCGDTAEVDDPAERLARWRRAMPAIETDAPAVDAILARSAEDLGALRVIDPEVPERAVIAAGAPWAMSLFGRDALLTAWMALLVDPELALGVLETLARFQGEEVDPRTEEQPGRILHQLQFGSGATLAHGRVTYQAVDSTPLFVMLLGELRRWGLAPQLVERLLPHADRALAWIAEYGDTDGDGYVEYQRLTDRGRLHQGWKDSATAIRFADGTIARPPIAPAEVQAYVYAAYVARSHFAREAGDEAGADAWRQRAADLRAAFNRDFWLDDRGWYAVALDHEKRPVDGLCSNVGHCLWAGIVDEERAPVVAAQLTGAELFSGWGVRTLASSMVGYNPVGYQHGAVWPHDTAIAIAGLVRYGFVDEAHRLVSGLFDAATAFGGRLPELFSGFGREEFSSPVRYPNACAPAAWAAASPLLVLRSLLRFDPWIPAGKLWLSPALPPGLQRVRIEGVPLLGGRLTLEVDGEAAKVEGLPPDVEVLSGPRSPVG